MGVALDAAGSKAKVKPNINVTPLVDVVLVLLIIFMLVIPNMQEGVPIELFKATNADKDDEDAEPIVVSIAQAKTGDATLYYLGDQAVSREALIAALAAAHEADPRKALLLRGDARLDYGKVREVFRECQNLGFAYVQLAVGAQKQGWED
jgi:biopolymer transport protein TolR